MSSEQTLSLSLIAFSLLMGACTAHIDKTPVRDSTSPCHIVYDAGSSSTRLHVYEATATGWVQHRGPRTGALADPVRGIHGKTMSDASAVVGDIVSALEGIRRDGPLDNNGQPEWPAFDWRKQCDVEAVAVYATAGMRLAEQQDANASEWLWKMLNHELSNTLGMTVTTRTLTGFEEGLFAWLAIREQRGDGNFGVAEMGGVSIQIGFPCPECAAARQVRVKGRSVPVFSFSFLGRGQDEAWKEIGPLPACARGVGIQNPGWQVTDCAAQMVLTFGLADDITGYIKGRGVLQWYLSGAFRYMHDTDIEQFCRKGIDSGFEPASSCFRAVYLESVLNTLGLPSDAKKSEVDWTLGAVVCTVTRCLDIQ